jgi:hypothetical protein
MWFSIRIVLLGLWVGAMAAFAFLFAPIAFAHVGPTPAFATTIAAAVRSIVRIGDWIAVIIAGITVFTTLESRRTAAIIVACLAVAILCGAYESAVVIPKMEVTPLLTPAYDTLHRQSSAVYGTAFIFAFAALALSSLRKMP